MEAKMMQLQPMTVMAFHNRRSALMVNAGHKLQATILHTYIKSKIKGKLEEKIKVYWKKTLSTSALMYPKEQTSTSDLSKVWQIIVCEPIESELAEEDGSIKFKYHETSTDYYIPTSSIFKKRKLTSEHARCSYKPPSKLKNIQTLTPPQKIVIHHRINSEGGVNIDNSCPWLTFDCRQNASPAFKDQGKPLNKCGEVRNAITTNVREK
ncbi:hypothetical protein CVS40_5005 [Lucilia cuprina]|nr:hypothetical protein CVS40_5005 [Lucilia cuprina]